MANAMKEAHKKIYDDAIHQHLWLKIAPKKIKKFVATMKTKLGGN